MKSAMDDAAAVERFIEYVRIPTVHPDPDCRPAASFIETVAGTLGLPCRVISLGGGKPIVIVSLVGSEPGLPSILLNSHMDVVPVVRDKWTVDPFGGCVLGDVVYGRGTQDCKSVGVQHLFAMGRLCGAGVVLRRSVHATFMPDEESGGTDGMERFVTSDVRWQLCFAHKQTRTHTHTHTHTHTTYSHTHTHARAHRTNTQAHSRTHTHIHTHTHHMHAHTQTHTNTYAHALSPRRRTRALTNRYGHTHTHTTCTHKHNRAYRVYRRALASCWTTFFVAFESVSWPQVLRGLNVGVALDEGLASETDAAPVFW